MSDTQGIPVDAPAPGARQEKQYLRFSRLNRLLHVVMIVTFISLALTGMTLKFSYTGWAVTLSHLLGGFESAGYIHRLAAVFMVGIFILHVNDLFRRKKKEFGSWKKLLAGPDTMLPTRKDLREHATKVPRMLATARVSKHTMFSFIPPSWTPSEQVVVFPLPSWTAFAVLQSRVHAAWVALNATHMGEGLRYSASECFATFPFPDPDPTATLPELETLGRSLYERRAAVLARTQDGLTSLYNDLKDSAVADAAVVALRVMHEQLDHAVIAAYGWHDLVVPAFAGHADASQAFEDDLFAHLVALNVARATAAAVPNAAPTVAPASAGPALAKTKPPRKGVATATASPPRQRRKASEK